MFKSKLIEILLFFISKNSMLCSSKKPNNNDLFQVPFGPTLTWESISNIYPNVVETLDGKCEENFLLFYYEYNPVNGIYKPHDEDTENDLADLFGLDIYNISNGETIDEHEKRFNDEDRFAFMAALMEEPVDIKKKKVAKKNESKEDEEILKKLGITIAEYQKMNNPDSTNSTSSMTSNRSFESDGGDCKKRKAKKERRLALVQSRSNPQ